MPPLWPPTSLLDARYPPELAEAFERALRPAPDAAPLTDPEWHALITRAAELAVTAPVSIRVRSGRLSNVGMMRAMNEDSLAVIECQAVQESLSAGLGLYVVADGMGGYEGGEIASAIAIATVTERMLLTFITPQFSPTAAEPGPDQITAWLTEAVQTANQNIHAARSERNNEMGTTLVGLVVAGDRAYIANVGDSRAYLLRKGEQAIKQVSIDHSLVQRLVATGQSPPKRPNTTPIGTSSTARSVKKRTRRSTSSTSACTPAIGCSSVAMG